MGRHSTIDFRSYDDTNVSSIYLNVYKQTLNLPGTSEIYQQVINRFASTRVVGMEIVDKTYNNDYVPHFKFLVSTSRGPLIETEHFNGSDNSERYGVFKNVIRLGWDSFLPVEEEILQFFAQNVGSERQYPVHMHGLMNMSSVKHGTKGNKNLYVPWFLHQLIVDVPMSMIRQETEARLGREARKYLDNPEFNTKFITERDRLGKQGVIDGLKKVKHLPLDLLKEALREFLCMDVMDEDDFGV